MKRVFALCLLVYVVPASAGEVKLDGQLFTLPDGFTIERVAGPPLVDRPVSADFDDVGRLYVTDSSGSNLPLTEQLQEKPHRVVRLEDTDGDGVYDKSVVFADNLMFPEGAMWYDGSLYVGAPPSIWKLTDTDGDGRADERVEWYQGKTLTGCGNDLHGPYLGRDGWIYWCKGAWAEQTFDRPSGKPFVTMAAHIFRCPADTPLDPKTGSIDTSYIEPVMTGGMDNPVEVAFTPGGERLFTSTFVVYPGGGLRDGLMHAVYGGVYGKPKEEVFVGHPRTGDVMPVLKHFGPAAPSGLAHYESAVFGPEYQDSFFASLFNMRKVTRHTLIPDGTGFTTEDEDFLVSDHVDFHPTDVLEDADGSLVVVNTGGWYKLCCPTSHLEKPDVLGAIYRVRKTDASQPQDPWGKQIHWASISAKGLTKLLGDPRSAVRRRAISSLGKRGEPAVNALREVVDPSKNAAPRARLNAVWALTRIDSASARSAVRSALADPDETVRQAACHSVSLWRDGAAVSELVGILGSASAQNRRAAAEALGRIGDPQAVPALLAAAAETHDRIGQHSLTFALIEIAAVEQTRAGLNAKSAAVRSVALMALDQMSGGGVSSDEVVPLLTSQNNVEPILRQTADWIIGSHPEWGDALVDYFRAELKALPPDAAAAENSSGDFGSELQQRLSRFVSNPAIRQLLVEVLQEEDFPPAARTFALRAIAESGEKTMPAAWAAEFPRLLRTAPVGIATEIVAALKKVSAEEAGSDALAAELLALGSDPNRPTELRLAALSVAPGGLKQVDQQLFELLSRSLDGEQPVSTRAAAVEVLTKAKLTTDQLVAVADRLPTVSPLDIDPLLQAFESAADEAVGLALVRSLAVSPARSALREETLKPRLEKYPPSVAEEAERLYEVLRQDRADQYAQLMQLQETLPAGDIRRGLSVFRSAKAACSSCHEIGYLGGDVGPDLTHIARIRSHRDLLEAIVFPSASLVRSYEPSSVVTANGLVHNGLIRQETGDGILLATGPDKQVRIPRDEIEEILPSDISVMPAGLDKQLTPQQLADLLAFLESTK